MIVHTITARQLGESGVYFIDLPQYLAWRWSLAADSAEAVENIARHKISDITGKGSAEFGLVIEWID